MIRLDKPTAEGVVRMTDKEADQFIAELKKLSGLLADAAGCLRVITDDNTSEGQCIQALIDLSSMPEIKDLPSIRQARAIAKRNIIASL